MLALVGGLKLMMMVGLEMIVMMILHKNMWHAVNKNVLRRPRCGGGLIITETDKRVFSK